MNSMDLDVYAHDAFSGLVKTALDQPPRSELAAKTSAPRRLTLAKCARLMGYESPRAVAMILKGERFPNEQALQRFCKWLNLDAASSHYVSLLVKRDRKPSSSEVEKLSAEIQSFRENRFAPSLLSDEAFHFVSQWHHLVIKQMVAAPNFVEDPLKMAKQLKNKVSIEEISASIQLMLNLGILERSKNGKLSIKPQHRSVQTKKDHSSIAVRRFHAQMMQRAVEALVEQNPSDREMMSLSLRVDARRIPEIKDYLRESVEEFHRRFFADDQSHVTQLNLQFFSHTVLSES